MKLFVWKSLLLLIFLFLTGGIALAQTAYVTDTTTYKVRSERSLASDSNVIGAVHSGDRVEILERDTGWIKIRTPKGTVGWIVDRYIVSIPPARTRAIGLEERNKGLRDDLAALKKEFQSLKEERDALSAIVTEKDKALADAASQYDALMGEPNEAMQLRVEKERMQKELETQKEVIEGMDAALWERNIKLFSLGAGVLFFGLLFGLYMGRKSRRSYY